MTDDPKNVANLTLEVLIGIRQELVGTNSRLDETNARLDETRTELGARIDQTRTELSARIDETRTELSAKIDQVRIDLCGRIDATNSRIDGLQANLLDQVLYTSKVLTSMAFNIETLKAQAAEFIAYNDRIVTLEADMATLKQAAGE